MIVSRNGGLEHGKDATDDASTREDAFDAADRAELVQLQLQRLEAEIEIGLQQAAAGRNHPDRGDEPENDNADAKDVGDQCRDRLFGVDDHRFEQRQSQRDRLPKDTEERQTKAPEKEHARGKHDAADEFRTERDLTLLACLVEPLRSRVLSPLILILFVSQLGVPRLNENAEKVFDVFLHSIQVRLHGTEDDGGKKKQAEDTQPRPDRHAHREEVERRRCPVEKR